MAAADVTVCCALHCFLRYDYDLDAWRKGSYLPNKEFEIMDADDQAGRAGG